MKNRTAPRSIATAALVLAVLSSGPALFAQAPVRVNTPGTAFSPEGRGGQVVVEDVGDGRRFRGQAFATVTLRAVLQMPPSSSAEPKMQRLAVHFRTSPSGPSLRSVELRNGSKVEFHIETHLAGDFTARETTQPEAVANTWVFDRAPISVSSQSVLRLEVQFPGGFDSQIDPGELFLTAVTVDFPRKLGTVSETLPLNEPFQRLATPRVVPPASTGVLYALAENNDLLWYGHSGWADGSFRWAAPVGKMVGTGWGFKQVFSGGDGVIYAITSSGDLLWYRHDGRADGSVRWAAPEGKKVGTGWDFEQVFSGGGGVIYAITASGDLLWYRHDGRSDGSVRWAAPEGKKVGTGWNLPHVFSGGGGVIYVVTANGDLLWYRHDGRDDGTFRWATPEGKKVGTGWTFKRLFSSGGGVIYGVTATGDLLWYRHDGRSDGSFRWAASEGRKVGTGWTFQDVFSGESLAP